MVAPMSIKPNQSLTAPKTPLEVDITRSLANPADHLPSHNIRVSGFERFQSNQRQTSVGKRIDQRKKLDDVVVNNKNIKHGERSR